MRAAMELFAELSFLSEVPWYRAARATIATSTSTRYVRSENGSTPPVIALSLTQCSYIVNAVCWGVWRAIAAMYCCGYVFYNFSNKVSCEFDKFRVDAHLCKLRNTPLARFSFFKLP